MAHRPIACHARARAKVAGVGIGRSHLAPPVTPRRWPSASLAWGLWRVWWMAVDPKGGGRPKPPLRAALESKPCFGSCDSPDP